VHHVRLGVLCRTAYSNELQLPFYQIAPFISSRLHRASLNIIIVHIWLWYSNQCFICIAGVLRCVACNSVACNSNHAHFRSCTSTIKLQASSEVRKQQLGRKMGPREWEGGTLRGRHCWRQILPRRACARERCATASNPIRRCIFVVN
jgi:hypothetical protein